MNQDIEGDPHTSPNQQPLTEETNFEKHGTIEAEPRISEITIAETSTNPEAQKRQTVLKTSTLETKSKKRAAPPEPQNQSPTREKKTIEISANQGNVADRPRDEEDKKGSDRNEQGITVLPNSSPAEEGNREENDNEEEGNWIEARRRRRRRISSTIIGTKHNDDEDIQPASRNAWLYVGKLRSSTTEQGLKNYFQRNGIEREIECEMLNTRGTMKAFKVGIPFEYLNEVGKAEFWPAGIHVRRFRFFRGQRQNDGVALE